MNTKKNGSYSRNQNVSQTSIDMRNDVTASNKYSKTMDKSNTGQIGKHLSMLNTYETNADSKEKIFTGQSHASISKTADKKTQNKISIDIKER